MASGVAWRVVGVTPCGMTSQPPAPKRGKATWPIDQEFARGMVRPVSS